MKSTYNHHFIRYIFFFILTAYSFAEIPDGYYDNAFGEEGEGLQSALHNIIDNHNVQSYGSLHGHYETTDDKPDGTVWDMYSDVPGGTPPYIYNFTSSDQCGNYGGEGDCYNREHSWPKSWFNDASPMKTDLFHVYPTDGYVNGMRGNYPYGEVGNASWTSQNGSKRGSCSFPGYSGTVFEPIDEYKGDLARTYFYMSTRYYNEDSSWDNNGMVNGADLLPWAVNLLISWHEADPVSLKEVDRNDAVYQIQNNRNPFIDHPEWVSCIWDGSCEQLPGDLNGDLLVDVLDIVMIVDVILYGEFSEYQLLAGDLNVDGVLDVLDIVMLVDLILG
ncbi:MAG: endonuclease I [Candidatus Marinimicrobia bacterium]|jgi:endonuclease I|nr:endonuclease I [Candidatus Neomarinimicrobiota bacterium]MBT3633735.1 endonuclease I [Candidatus Neomarinimicrobiota bacterium]MBT3682527.1 endonuclease I [Candidatus Neomarinimicrobiota bacterium]MBT3759291.1 endonuclease I [Candidatus Neomarinimicrobiota bacterium]MBT3894701.1 endonuclease I [Candidatus Neomarinimicrobiota bacterium]